MTIHIESVFAGFALACSYAFAFSSSDAGESAGFIPFYI
jgi:hypothetical protein